MKYLAIIAVNIFISYGLGLFLPWWSIVITPFLTGFLFDIKSMVHFLLGFISIFILWTTFATIAQQGQAAELVIRIGQLFNGLSPMILILITGLIGGLYGSLAELSGRLLKKLVKK